jgi:hypothetical protein
MSNTPISEQWYSAALKHADLEAAASMLEENKSAVLSQSMTKLGDIPVSRAELIVKASADWAEYIRKMCEARTAANKAKVEMEYLKMRAMEWQSHEATARTQARL